MWSPLALRPPRAVAPAPPPAEVGRAGLHELRPPVREVRRHLDAHARQQPPGLAHEPDHVLYADRAGPLRRVALRRVGHAGAPVALGGAGGDLGRLLPVVAAVGDEVLEDDLLD